VFHGSPLAKLGNSVFWSKNRDDAAEMPFSTIIAGTLAYALDVFKCAEIPVTREIDFRQNSKFSLKLGQGTVA